MKKKLLTLALFTFTFSLFASSQIISTVAGNGTAAYSGDGGQATAAGIYTPAGVFPDASGNFYISAQTEHRVRFVNNAGVISTFAGNGTQGFSGDGGPATAAEFYFPTDVSLDNAGNVYIDDLDNFRIRMINTSGIISTVAGNGTSGSSGDGGPATAAELSYAWGACCDAAGNVYIADGSNRVRIVNTSGIINTFAGNGLAGYSGDGGQATAAELNTECGVYPDNLGNVFIADYANNRIRLVNTSGIISTVAGNGLAGYSGDGGQATAAEINAPTGVCTDAVGNIYIAEYSGNRVRIVATNGIITTLAGNGVASYSGDGGPATAAEVNVPSRVHIDLAGDAYIADRANNRIRKISGIPLGFNQPVSNVMAVYPNPASNNITVQLSNTSSKMMVTMYTITGQEVLNTVKENTSSFSINTTNLAAGTYMLKLQSADGSVITKKIEIAR